MNDSAAIAKIKNKEKSWYCRESFSHPLHKKHHDEVYGFAVKDDDELFARLCMEVHQAGLSWLLILKKEKALLEAWDGFKTAKVAGYGEAKIAKLLADQKIIRNRAKIRAVIHNANVALGLEGGFYNWMKSHHPMSLEGWVKLFRKTFKFCGPELTNEFLLSGGWLPGAHSPSCPIYERVVATDPPFLWGQNRS